MKPLLQLPLLLASWEQLVLKLPTPQEVLHSRQGQLQTVASIQSCLVTLSVLWLLLDAGVGGCNPSHTYYLSCEEGNELQRVLRDGFNDVGTTSIR